MSTGAMALAIKTRGNDYSWYDCMLLAKPRKKEVATNGVKCGRACGSRLQRKCVKASWEAGRLGYYPNRKVDPVDLFEDE